MPKFAYVENGVVITTVQADSPDQWPDLSAKLVQCGDEVMDNWRHDGQAFAPPTANTVRVISALGFYNRFTDAEQIAIELASRANSAEGAMLALWMKKTSASVEIHLDAEMQARLEVLAQLGLIAPERVAEIMA